MSIQFNTLRAFIYKGPDPQSSAKILVDLENFILGAFSNVIWESDFQKKYLLIKNIVNIR